jgi:DNA-binding XRE family transcriptional regulator
MAKNFNNLRRVLDTRLAEHPDGDTIRERNRVELNEELDAHAVSLAELRKARALTQVQIAENLDVSQAQVSRIEKQADLYLSTLARYIEATGGRLEINAIFDTQHVSIALHEITRLDDAETSGRPLQRVK